MSGKDARRMFALLAVGERFSFVRTIGEADIDAFAGISGDESLLHADSAHARACGYDARLVHGMLLGSLVSRLVGMHLSRPGMSFVCLKVALEFKKPVYAGDTIRVAGTLASKSEAVGVVAIELVFARGEEVVATGIVHAKLLDRG